MSGEALLHRDLGAEYPLIDRGEGSYLIAEDGRRFLDASSGAVAANLGHGVAEIAEAMAEQARRVGFAHTLRFETRAAREAAELIRELAPAELTRVFLATGGSEANESALKLARQFHVATGNPGKYLAIGRWDSYHGNTLGALSVGGDVARRTLYEPMTAPALHLPSWREGEPGAAAEELRRMIRRHGAGSISALILEPIVGSQLGAYEPPAAALREIAAICAESEILLIADEVMTGFGRTGANFAIEHSGIVPDLLTFGKGVTAGYAPLSGMLIHERVVAAIEASGGVFHHGYTYSGHPVVAAAAAAALRYSRDRGVLAAGRRQGELLRAELEGLARRFPVIAEVRGRGLLLAIELDPERLVPGDGAAEVNREAMRLGLVLYPGQSTGADGRARPHLLVAPPLTLTDSERAHLIELLERTLSAVQRSR